MSIERFVSQLDDYVLEKCFLDMMCEREGLQLDGIIYDLWEQFKKENRIDVFPIRSMYEPILYEIAKRKYRDDGIDV